MPAFQTRSKRIAHWTVGILYPPPLRSGDVWERKGARKVIGNHCHGIPRMYGLDVRNGSWHG